MNPAEPEEHTRPQTEADAIAAAAAVFDSSRELTPGMRLGPYRLLKPLGHGGMGQVWLAEQQEPLLRQVALKLQKQRLASGMSEAYFQVERQALAKLVHPYIGQIYDAGTLPDGALYFAMEYIDGQTLDRYVSGRRLSVEATVDLLIKVCQGVQHAHQRGLIHRDLKPGNLLVIEVGGQAIPKIIDFGVAIGIDPRSGVAQTQRRAGTRAYMAPEQHVPTAEGIDVRADVHALGTLLAECLCLSLDITLDLLGSDRLRALFAASATSAPDQEAAPTETTPPRGLPGQRAIRRVPAELRAIVRKAMAVDRNQRYASAAALADDLERWRQARPVQAMGLGRWYAVRCFVRRYRIATAAGVLVFLALVAGLVTAMYGLREAQSARALAEERRDKAEQLIGYMLGDFADKLRQLGKLELLDGVSTEAMKYLGDANSVAGTSALFRARAMRTLGEAQAARGQYEEAEKVFADAEALLGTTPTADVEASEWWLERGNMAYWRGYARFQLQDLDGAERHWREYEATTRALIPLTRDSGKGLLESSYAHNNLGTLAFQRGDLENAKEYFESSIREKKDFLDQHPESTDALEGLANSHSWLGRVLENLSELRPANEQYVQQAKLLERLMAARGNDSEAIKRFAGAKIWLGTSALDLGHGDEAISSLTESVRLLDGLLALEPEQVVWEENQQTARAELAWATWLTRGDVSGPREVFVNLLAEIRGDRSKKIRAQRLWLKSSLRLAAMSEPAERKELLALAYAGLGPPLGASKESFDIRLLQALSLERLRAGLRLEVAEEKLLDQLININMDGAHYRDLELLGRLAKIRGNEALVAQIVGKLDTIGYQHPEFIRQIKP